MGVYYANLSFVEFSTMILGITCICIHWLYGYRYTVSSFVQYVVTILTYLLHGAESFLSS